MHDNIQCEQLLPCDMLEEEESGARSGRGRNTQAAF